MSLTKQYQLHCDAGDLQMDRALTLSSSGDDFERRLREDRAARSAEREGCVYYSVLEYNSREARKSAKAQGWTRYSEERAVYVGADETVRKTYDLCASCAPKLART